MLDLIDDFLDWFEHKMAIVCSYIKTLIIWTIIIVISPIWIMPFIYYCLIYYKKAGGKNDSIQSK